MKNLKFRAWGKEAQEMFEVEAIDFKEKALRYVDNPTGYGCDALLSQVELMQFTGILDGTGAEIYEGDILCWPSHEGTKHQQRFVVEWCDDRNGWLNWHSTREQAVVIGNIHENPELLTT